MVKISLVVCVLAIFAFAQVVNSKATAPAPPPAVDCSTIIFSMADCLTFVTNGSKIIKPEGTCCNGLKTVLKTDAECICEVFKNSGSLGIVLDIKKALTLPAACGVSAPSIDKCGLALALSPGAAPAQSPISTVVPPITSGTPSLAPAPSPAQDTTPGSSQVAAPPPAPSAAAPPPSPSAAAPAPVPSAASTSTISSLALLVSLVAASYSFL